jgi:hypothetical protein
MSTRSRRWLLAGLALADLAVPGVVGLLAWGGDTPEAARRRVPLGADEDAVAAAVGRPHNGGEIYEENQTPERLRRGLFWEYGGDRLYVWFDERGRAVKVGVVYAPDPTLWQRLRAWLGW